MSDFHDRLDRASRAASPRPDALDRLRDRRHRHERRQRVTATVVGLAITVMLVGGGFALLNGRDDVRPGGTGTQPMYLGLWPERTLAEAQQVQSAVDSGDQTESWRTDPEEVAKRFVTDVMGWDEKSLSATLEGDSLGRDRLPIHVQGPPPSCPYPGCPWWMDRSQWVTVERVVTGGDVWAVVFTQTMPPMRSQYAIGQDVDTNAPLKGWIDSGSGEPIILGGEGGSPCSGGEVIEVFGPDLTANYTSMKAQVSSFRSPDCGQTGEGYIALGVTDDGVPLLDPLTSWGSRSGPRPVISALTMVPVRFVESLPSPGLSPEPELYFPMTQDGPSGEQALSRGPIVERDGCVFLGTDAPYVLPVWPKDFTAERDESGAVVVRDDKGQIIAIEGEPFDMGGGMAAEFSPAGNVEPRSEQLQSLTDWLGYEIPGRCLGPDVDGVWAVGETHPLLSPGPPIPGIELIPRPSGSGASSQTVPDVAQITCVEGRTRLSTPEIRPQADGYHFSVQVQDNSRALLFHRPGSDSYSSTWGPQPAASWEAVVQLSEGDFVVSCHADGPDGTRSEPGAPLIHLDPFSPVPDETYLSAYLVQSGLMDRVMAMAAANEVPQPDSIQAVVAAPNEVTALLNEVPAAHGPPSGDLVFVQVTGSFVCHTCKQLSDSPITGSAMYVEAKLGTSGIIGWGILKDPLDLSKLGTPVDIPVPG